MILKTQRTVVKKAEKRAKRRLAQDLKQQAKMIASLFDKLDSERDFFQDVESILNQTRLKTMAWFGPDTIALYKLGARYVRKAAQGNVDLQQINLLAVKRVQGLKFLRGTAIDGSVMAHSLQRIKEIVADGIFNGTSYVEMGKQILAQTKEGIFSPARAELIAVNTVGNAYEQGRYESIIQLKHKGYRVRKKRSTVGDNKVTPQCRENEGRGRLELNENWPSGDAQAPRAGNPRCRCTTNYEVL